MACLGWLVCVCVAAGPAVAAEYVVNTSHLTIKRDGVNWNFGGELASASILNGVAHFYIGGDLILDPGDVFRGEGVRPASFHIGNDLVVPPTATIDFSAIDTTAGPGGGASGTGGGAGQGGLPGDPGDGGGVQWVRGGGAMIFFIPGAVPPPVPAFPGRGGTSGTDGDVGDRGTGGNEGGKGFNNPTAVASGGVGGFDGNSSGFGGFGGPGGSPGVYWPSPLPSFLPGVPTKDGGDGIVGGLGSDGDEGEQGGNGHGGKFSGGSSFELVAGNGGGGGGGGQGGSGGGGGGGGGGGAAGQGNWAKSFGFAGFNIASFGGSGGPGADGGDGGVGGLGGGGGLGGAGGGAVEFLVEGSVDLQGEAHARGGDGQTGSLGRLGVVGIAGEPINVVANVAAVLPIPGVTTVPFVPPPPVPIPDPFFAGVGGVGANGSAGGRGGSGGDGGGGGGGSGGTVKLVGSTVGGSGTIDVSGGLGRNGGASFDDGASGQLLVGANTVAVGSSAAAALGGASLTGSDTSSRAGTVSINPLIADAPSTPNIVGLPGGAEAFGFTGHNANDIFLANNMNLVESTPAEAFAGLARFDLGPSPFDDDYLGYDMLLFYSAKGSPLNDPMLGVGEENYFVPLLEGGFANDPLFGGVGDVDVAMMDGFSVYATLIPEGAEWFNFSVDSGGIILSAQQQLLNDGELFFVTSSPDVPVLDATWAGGNGDWSNAANWGFVFHATGLPPDGTEAPPVPGVPSNSAAYAYNIHINNNAMVDADIVVTVDQLNIGAADSLTVTTGNSLTVERFAVRTDSGRIVNDGEILIDGSAGNTSRLFLSGPGLMLDGTGVLRTTNVLDNVIAGLRAGDSLTQMADHTIEATGLLGNNRLTVTNHGRVTTPRGPGLTIDPTGDAQRNAPGFTNHGVIDADSQNMAGASSKITLADGFFLNDSSGLLEARNGGELVLDSVRLHNDGTLHIDEMSRLTITGTSMLSGNGLSGDPYDAQISIIDADFVHTTDLVGNITIQNSTLVSVGSRLGGYSPTQQDLTSLSVSGSYIVGADLDGFIDLHTTSLEDVVFLPDAEVFAGETGLSGTIENRAGSGIGAFGNANGFVEGEFFLDDDTTLIGDGQWYLGSLTGDGPGGETVLTVGPQAHLVVGTLGNDDLVIDNRGTIEIEDTGYGGQVSIVPVKDSGGPGVRNAGVILDRSGGDTEFHAGVYDNTGGVFDVTFAIFYDVTLLGGTLKGDSIWDGAGMPGDDFFNQVIGTRFEAQDFGFSEQLIEVYGTLVLEDATFTADTILGGYDSFSQVVLRNSLNITDTGSLYLESLDLTLDNDLTLDSNGSALLHVVNVQGETDDVRLTIGDQFTLAVTNNSGVPNQLGQDSLLLDNRGTVQVDADSGLVIDPSSDMNAALPGLVNRGAINLADGELSIVDAYIDNTGGTIGGLGGDTYFVGVRVQGGTLINPLFSDSDPHSAYSAGMAAIEDVTLEGDGGFDVTTLSIAGTIENNAYLDVAVGTLTLDGPVRFTGTGTLEFSSQVLLEGSGDDDTLTNEAGHTIYFSSIDMQIQGDDIPQIINHGTLISDFLTLFESVYTSETLPAGTEVPDVSDPNNPDATMILAVDTTYDILRPVVNTGVMDVGEIFLTDATVQNSGGTIQAFMIVAEDSTILNDGGVLEGGDMYFSGDSVLTGGSLQNSYVTIEGASGDTTVISEISLVFSDVYAHSAVEFGGNVSGLSYLEVNSNDGPGGQAVFVQNQNARVEIDSTYLINGTIVLSAGAFRTATVDFDAGPYEFLEWTGGTFGLTSQDLFVGSVDALLGDTISLPGGFGLEAGTLLRIDADGTVVLNGGTLQATNIDHASGGVFDFTDGLLSVGTFMGDLVNGGGTVAPGQSPGLMAVTGSYTQSLGGTMQIEIADPAGGSTAAPDAGEDYDHVAVTGDVALDGVIEIHLIDGAEDAVSPYDQFTIVTWGTNAGGTVFDSVSVIAPQVPGLGFTLFYNANDLTVQAVATTGDANLDGVINLEDLVALAANFATAVDPRDWRLGNFDQDTDVDADDLTLLAENFAWPDTVAESDRTAEWLAGQIGVNLTQTPEPGTMIALVAVALSRAARRRRTGAADQCSSH